MIPQDRLEFGIALGVFSFNLILGVLLFLILKERKKKKSKKFTRKEKKERLENLRSLGLKISESKKIKKK